MKSPMKKKSPPCRIALRRKGNLSLKRPAAGGESYKVGFFLDGNINDERGKSINKTIGSDRFE